MGRDKALVPVDGVPMAQRVAAVLAGAGCAPVVTVGGDGRAMQALGLMVVPDRYPGEGPLGGIITALSATDAEAVMIVSCDVPHLRTKTVDQVVAALAEDVLVAVACTDRVQPLCAVWRRSALPFLRERFEGGERMVRAMLADLGAVEVPVAAEDLLNVNTMRDLPE
jgi:molybdopterin-guanine dinucleotide biosynthesis protein A